jgi:hypothetical protein
MPVNLQVKRTLAQLPYQEMKDLSEQVGVRLSSIPPEGEIAEILSTLSTEESERDRNQNAYLQDYFSRKRAITIRPHGDGWVLTCSTLDLTIHCTDLREGMSQLFDTLIGYLAISSA